MKSRRIALVTGCSSGIGKALANALLADSWQVIGLARRDSGIDHPDFRQVRLDLSDLDSLRTWAERDLAEILADKQLERFALINNAAAIGALSRLTDVDLADLARLLTVNTAAPVYLMGRAVRQAPASVKLRVVNISSGAARSAYPGLGDYCASKAALRMAGQALAAELQEDGRSPGQVSVFSYEPGVVATDMQVQARGADPDRFPGQASFQEFHDQGLLHDPAAVVGEIVDFAGGDPAEHFNESRYAG